MSETETESHQPKQGDRALKRLETYERRKLIAANLLSGLSKHEIAEKLDCTVGVVERDVRAIQKAWTADALDNIKAHKALDLRRLESAIGAIWDAVLEGKLGPIEKLTKLLDRKSKLLGMDAAQKIEQDTTIQFLVRAPQKLSVEEWDKMTTIIDAEVIENPEEGEVKALPEPHSAPSEGG